MSRPDFLTVPERFEFIVGKYSDKTAIIDRFSSVSFSELNKKANRVAHYLRSNYEKEESVVLYTDQGINHISLLLGISKSGKVSIPLNDSIPAYKVAEILKQYNSGLLITEDKYFETLKDVVTEYNIVVPDVSDQPYTELQADIDYEDEFIIFNTSGSTGKPKGVIHTHKSTLFFIDNYIDAYELKPHDIHSLTYPPGYYGTVRDILVPLLCGCTIARYSMLKDIEKPMEDWILDVQLTILSCPVKVFRDLMKSVKDPSKLKSIRMVRPGGDASNISDFKNFQRLFSSECKFFAGFASSETGLIRKNILSKDAIISSSSVPCGYSIDGIDVLLVDENGNRITEDDKIGNIVVESKYLFTGYKNSPALDDPRYVRDGIPVFETNDYGFYRNKCLYFQGRKDFHIKINGARINIEEITSSVLEMDQIHNAITLFDKEKQTLNLFYQSAKGMNPRQSAIKAHLKERLPYYALPSRYIKIDEIPVTQNGKVNRMALEQIPMQETPLDQEPTETEQGIIKIWIRVLKNEHLTQESNFFEYGGDSIRAALAIAEINQLFNVQLNEHVLYEFQTVNLLAEAINKRTFSDSNWLVPMLKGNKEIQLFWFAGYPEIVSRHIHPSATMYFVKSHYDNTLGIPSLNNSLHNYCLSIAQEIIEEFDGKKLILGGFSAGAIFAKEVSRILLEEGIVAKLFLLDPMDELKKYQIGEKTIMTPSKTIDYLLIYLRYLLFASLWNIGKTIGVEIIRNTRSKLIHSIYRIYRSKHSFQPSNLETILIQRNGNRSRTGIGLKDLFDPKELTWHRFDVKSHEDFFKDKKCIAKWMKELNRIINQ